MIRRPRAALVVAAVLTTAAACAGNGTDLTASPKGAGGRAAAPTTSAAQTSTTAAPTTTVPATAAPATPAATTTTTVVLPQPAPPPADERGEEPYVELGALEIPAIGMDGVLLEGIRLTTLDRGLGHWPGTAMPGELGNVVVAGHRTSEGGLFRHLDALAAGDEVLFTTAAGQFTYVVTAVEIVPPDAMWIVDQTAEHRATLFACHPPGSTRERIVAHLVLSSAQPAAEIGVAGDVPAAAA